MKKGVLREISPFAWAGALSSEVEAVKVHYLIPRRHEVVQELLPGVIACVDFR